MSCNKINAILLGLIPLGYLPIGINPQLPKFAFLAIVAVIYLISHQPQFPQSRWDKIWTIVWLLWITILTLSFSLSDALASSKRLNDWLLFAILHFTVIQFHDEHWITWAETFFWATGISAIYGLLQFIFHSIQIGTYATYTSTYSNTTYSGTMMAISFFVGMFTPFESSKRYRLILKYIFLFCIFGYLIQSGSRTGWVAFCLGGLAYSLLHCRKLQIWKSYVQFSSPHTKILLMMVILIGLHTLYSPYSSNIFKRLHELSNWQSGSVAVRQHIWDSTTNLIQDHPFGVGLGQFSHHFYQYRTIQEYELSDGRLVDHPHQSWLLVISESGIHAGLYFLGMMIGIGYCLYQTIRYGEPITQNIAITWASIFVVWLMSGMLMEVFTIPETGIFLPLLTGWLVSHFPLQTQDASTKNCYNLSHFKSIRFTIIHFFLIIFLTILITIGNIFPILGDIYLDLGQKHLQRQNYHQAHRLLEKSAFWYPSGFHRLELARSLLAIRNYTEALRQFKIVMRQAPELEGCHIDLGLTYYGLEDYENAIYTWKRANAYFPNNSTVYNNLVQLLLKMHQGEQALGYLLLWSSHHPNVADTPNYQLQLGQSYQLSGNMKDAMLAYIQVKEKFPENALAYLYLGQIMAEIGLRDSAIYHIQEAIRLGNQQEKCLAYCTMGKIIQQEGQPKLATVYFFKAKESHPNSSYPYLYLSQLALELNQEESAEKYLQKATQLGFSKQLITIDPSFQKLAQSQIYQKR